MLNNVKSLFFSRFLFSFVDEIRKLKIIKYNKRIQNNLDINIINYKIFSERYLILDTNGKGKEYMFLNNALIFEGEYLNGKRNGKGKEFSYNGELIFEGEYLNGKRSGKGKEYGNFGELIFEGEYINGKRLNGNGYHRKKVIYKLKNGKGFIKEYYGLTNKLKFEGEYSNGERNGEGKEFSYNGKLIFEGEYLNGIKWNGKVYYHPDNNIYILKNGKGFLKICNEDTNIFEGEYLNGKRNGKGKEFTFNKKLIFEGEYLNNKRNGKGKEYNYKGELIFIGEYMNNYKRKGKKYVKERLEYEGEFLFNKKWNGKGYDENGNLIYELKNGNGNVKEFNYDDVLIYEGEYLNGIRNGKGKEFSFKGDLIYEGEYLNGIKWNGKGYHGENNIIYELNNVKGFIKDYYAENFFYEGECFNGLLDGKGTKIYIDGSRYKGEFKKSHLVREGYGILYFQNGDIYEGEFKNDFIGDYGIYYFSNGERYEGEFKGNNGKTYGIYYFSNGERYEGEFKSKLIDGYGIYYFSNGDRYEGEFKKGIYDGYGIFYSTLGFKFKGYFKKCISIKILVISYKILLFLKRLFSKIKENKAILSFIIILISGILFNQHFK